LQTGKRKAFQTILTSTTSWCWQFVIFLRTASEIFALKAELSQAQAIQVKIPDNPDA